jgi:hypothetical protein
MPRKLSEAVVSQIHPLPGKEQSYYAFVVLLPKSTGTVTVTEFEVKGEPGSFRLVMDICVVST